jgi:hypothetical protein
MGEAMEKLEGVENTYNVVSFHVFPQWPKLTFFCVPSLILHVDANLPWYPVSVVADCAHQPGEEDSSRHYTRVPGRTTRTSLFYVSLEDMR